MELVRSTIQTGVLSKWGNSKALRIPSEILKDTGLNINDRVYFSVLNSDKIVITKIPEPQKGTLEYLFNDYSGESFQTNIVELGEPIGKEKW